MNKEGIKGGCAAESTARHIEDLILEGSLRPGEPLLAEREMALRLNVSRPTLRQGMKLLEDKGLLVAEPGGARVVAPLATSITDPLIELMSARSEIVVRTTSNCARTLERMAARGSRRCGRTMSTAPSCGAAWNGSTGACQGRPARRGRRRRRPARPDLRGEPQRCAAPGHAGAIGHAAPGRVPQPGEALRPAGGARGAARSAPRHLRGGHGPRSRRRRPGRRGAHGLHAGA